MDLNRRRFLKGLGVSLALPLFERDALAFGLKNESPMRMVCVSNPLGYIPDQFFPTDAGRNYKTTPLLKSLPRDKFTVFSNLDHGVTGGHQGVHAFLSGIRDNESNQFESRNITVDQRAAEFVGAKTRFPSLVASVGSPGAELSCQNSWTRNGVNVPPVTDEMKIFRALFVEQSNEGKRKEREIYRKNTSVLDSVKEQARILSKELSTDDRRKLDEYFVSVREVEKQMAMSRQWVDQPKPKVDLEIPRERQEFPKRVPLFYKLIQLALQTDSTRVATLAIPGTLPVGELGLSGSYHAFSHHGKDSTLRAGLSVIEQYQMKQLAEFIKSLDKIVQPDGRTLLDCTMVLSGSGMGNGSSHSNKKLPVLLAGGGFKHGSHLILPDASHKKIPLCNLYTSMLQKFGVEVDKFNLANGTLTALENA